MQRYVITTAGDMTDICVIVLSCDRYSDFWPLFARRWRKYWPECPFPVYILSNERDFELEGIRAIKVGPDINWSRNLRVALSQIAEPRVLLMMEDAPLAGMVSNHAIAKLIEIFSSREMNYLNLKASPPPRQQIKGQLVASIPSGALYRVAAVPSLWKKSVLLELLMDGETAWQFEIQGSRRSNGIPGFFVTGTKAFELLHCVIKGKIDPRAERRLRIDGDRGWESFPVMGRGEFFLLRLREFRSAIFGAIVPRDWQVTVRDLVASIASPGSAPR